MYVRRKKKKGISGIRKAVRVMRMQTIRRPELSRITFSGRSAKPARTGSTWWSRRSKGGCSSEYMTASTAPTPRNS
ncbi:hypothetical protein SO802_032867 [Lithocarpus litseifolius]|uniref:Uncharacterized protein n=1 Tax=Lithocarpus litseifolius TaxID=425828 RepID=A0AAW2BDE8_9ROSI